MDKTCVMLFFVQFTFICTFALANTNFSQISDDLITKERLLQSKRISSVMDHSANPCEDFDQYACGNFHKYYKDLLYLQSLLISGLNVIDFLHDVLMENVNKSVSSELYSASDKARIFYQSCMQADIFKFQKSEAYLKIVDSLGGWPAFKSEWKEEDFNWYNFTVTAKSYNVDIFLKADFNRWTEETTITSKCFGISNCMNHEKTYSLENNRIKSISMQLMKMYGVPLSSARKILREVLQFGKEHSAFLKGQQNAPRANLTDLEDYISVLFNGTENASEDQVIVEAVQLNRFSEFIRGKERPAANYAVLLLLSILHTELGALQDQKLFCYKQLNSMEMQEVLTMLFLQNSPEQPRIDDEVRTLFQVIRNAYSESIKNASWPGGQVKKELLDKILHMEATIGSQNMELDEDKFNQQFENLIFDPSNGFHENALIARKFLIGYKHSKSYSGIRPNSYSLAPHAFYSVIGNTLTVLVGILQKPNYFPDMPSSYNFARLGFMIAHEAAHGFDSERVLLNKGGNLVDWDNASLSEYEQRMNCFIEQYGNFKIKQINEKVNGKASINENIADNIGLRQAFFAYKKWLKMNEDIIDEDKETLSGLELSKYKLFFVNYAQNFCMKLKRKDVLDSRDNTHAMNIHRVIGSISNFDQFANAFGCPEDSPMNPKHKCVIF